MEAEIKKFPVLSCTRSISARGAKLVIGSAVVGLNWASRLIVFVRTLIGSNLPGTRLIDEARRTAIVRKDRPPRATCSLIAG